MGLEIEAGCGTDLPGSAARRKPGLCLVRTALFSFEKHHLKVLKRELGKGKALLVRNGCDPRGDVQNIPEKQRNKAERICWLQIGTNHNDFDPIPLFPIVGMTEEDVPTLLCATRSLLKNPFSPNGIMKDHLNWIDKATLFHKYERVGTHLPQDLNARVEIHIKAGGLYHLEQCDPCGALTHNNAGIRTAVEAMMRYNKEHAACLLYTSPSPRD